MRHIVWSVLLFLAGPALAQAPRITPNGDPSVRNDTIYRLAVNPADHPNEAYVYLLDDGVVREVIVATNFTMEGEATAHYIAELLLARNLKVSRIARGLPVGGELEHVDSGTLAQAVLERRPA